MALLLGDKRYSAGEPLISYPLTGEPRLFTRSWQESREQIGAGSLPLELVQHNSHHVLLAKTSYKISPDSRGREIDCIS